MSTALRPTDTVFVTGHRGMVGSALVRSLQGKAQVLTATRQQLDLTRQADTEDWLATHRPDVVIIAAAKVGGIHANSTYPADFIYENLMIAANTIHAAYKTGVRRLLFLGSSCIYPRAAPQPMTEDCLLTSPLEPTNEAYAIAKIAGLKLCQHYRTQHGVMYHSGMPTNLYGPGDNYHPENSHVIPGMIHRFHQARLQQLPQVTCWGSGTPKREFLHVDDLAQGCLHLLHIESPPHWVNLGTGVDCTIRELAETVAEVTGYTGTIHWDSTKPDGTPRKLMDVSQLQSLGWSPQISLKDGLTAAYAEYTTTLSSGTVRS
jgi:GDP-L-fucose synthase